MITANKAFIKEDLVKLLLPIGFPFLPCPPNFQIFPYQILCVNPVDGHGECFIPTLQEVQDWLRREREIYIDVSPTWGAYKHKLPGSWIAEFEYRNSTGRFVGHCLGTREEIYHDYPTYEDALEAAIKEAIKIYEETREKLDKEN